METNKIDTIVKESLKSRAIAPSGSAWERLSDQLDALPKQQRRNWFSLVGYAASILLIVSVAFFINTDDKNLPIVPNKIVVQPIDTSASEKHNFKIVAPIEEAIVELNLKNELPIISKPIKKFLPKKNRNFKAIQPEVIDKTGIALVDKIPVIQKEVIEVPLKKTLQETKKASENNRIKVDRNALLYAVTHTEVEVKDFYTKYTINREEALQVVQKELRRMHIKIDATTMLAEIEKNIGEESFKRNFMRTIKGKVTGLAIAFSNRNN